MLQKFFEAIQQFFTSIFGGGSKELPKPDPVIDTGDKEETKPPIIEDVKPKSEEPQDGSETDESAPEVKQVSEEVEVVVKPGEADVEFDEDATDESVIDESELDIAEEEPADITPGQRYLWCLDNGHGILTAGKRSPFFGDGRTQFREYEFNRDIVARIMEALDHVGIEYYNVVPEVEIGDFLEGRVRRANAKSSSIPKIYLSIHSNAGPAASPNDWTPNSVNGIETWYYHGSKKGRKVASIFQNHLIDATKWTSRGLKSRSRNQFYVLRKTRMTAVLTENGFYNNRQQVQELMKEEVRQKIAEAHVKAILEIEREGI